MPMPSLPERARRAQPAARSDAGGQLVPPRVMASWQRSENYGVSLDAIDPVFTGNIDDHSLFFECGDHVLEQLWPTLAGEPVSLILTDSDGLVLSRRSGDSSLVRALDEVYLAPGFTFSEREAGTNGLALALADRVPTLVKADEHYCADLFGFTCAAVPVNDPTTGELVGSVNLSTWSRSSSQLLLALAQSAANSTSSLMLARSDGRAPRRSPRGEVFRVEPARLLDNGTALADLSTSFSAALVDVERALSSNAVVSVVGEPGTGRASLLAMAHRRIRPRDRLLSASPPDPRDVEAWLSLWTPELSKNDTGIIVRDVDTLPRWAATQLGTIFHSARNRPHSSGLQPFSMTVESFQSVPEDLRSHIDTVVRLAPLRERLADVEPLARHFAAIIRGHEITFTSAALRALGSFEWPGNVAQLRRVVRDAATSTDRIDIQHLPADVVGGSRFGLTRIESFERNEIIRCLSEPGVSVGSAATELGMSRATIYRKIARYNIHIPMRDDA